MTTVDVIPLGDVRRHLVPGGYDDDEQAGWLALERKHVGPAACWCAPALVPVVDEAGELGAQVVHHSADGREREETT